MLPKRPWHEGRWQTERKAKTKGVSDPVQHLCVCSRYHVAIRAKVKLSRRNSVLQGIWCEIVFDRVLLFAAKVNMVVAALTGSLLNNLPSVWEPGILFLEKRWQCLRFKCCFRECGSGLGLPRFMVLAAHVD